LLLLLLLLLQLLLLQLLLLLQPLLYGIIEKSLFTKYGSSTQTQHYIYDTHSFDLLVKTICRKLVLIFFYVPCPEPSRRVRSSFSSWILDSDFCFLSLRLFDSRTPQRGVPGSRFQVPSSLSACFLYTLHSTLYTALRWPLLCVMSSMPIISTVTNQ
jgi:hypothetical protein